MSSALICHVVTCRHSHESLATIESLADGAIRQNTTRQVSIVHISLIEINNYERIVILVSSRKTFTYYWCSYVSPNELLSR